jgi:hypothetical protein
MCCTSRIHGRALRWLSIGTVCISACLTGAASNVMVLWEANTELDLAGYKVYWGTGSRNYNNIVDAGNKTNQVVSNLVSGVTYYFAVTAYNSSAMESDFSLEASYTVDSTNTPPVISNISDTNATANGIVIVPFTVGDAETAAGNLSVSGTSSNPTLIPNSNIVFGGSNSNRTVRLTPASNQVGIASINVTVSDGALSASDSFALTVSAATNAPPLLSSIPGTTIFVNGSSFALHFSVSDRETAPDALSISAVSSNPALISNTNIFFAGSGSNRTIILNSAANQTGTAAITVMAGDGQNTTTTSFQVTVIARPSELVYLPFEAEAGSITAPMAVSTDPVSGAYVSSPMDEQGTVSFQVPVSVPGTYIIWARIVAVDGAHDSFYVSIDGGPEDIFDMAVDVWSSSWQWDRVTGRAGSSNSIPMLVPRTFQLSAGSHSLAFRCREDGSLLDRVIVCNDLEFVPQDGTGTPPTPTAIPNQSIQEDTSSAPISFTISDAETSATDLSVSAQSSNPVLVPNNNITFGGTGSNRTLVVTAAADQSGTATITVTVSDGSMTSSTDFVLSVNPVNDPPTISDIPDIAVYRNTSTDPIPFSIGDIDTPVENLIVSASSSDPLVVPDSNILLEGSGNNRTVTITPATDQVSAATITITVSDGLLTASDSFVFKVRRSMRIKSIAVVGSDDIRLTWESSPGAVYGVLGKTLTQSSWRNLTTNLLATGPETSWIDTHTSADVKLYQIVELEPAP